MAFQFSSEDRRGNPKITRLGGEWIAVRQHFSSTWKTIEAEKVCKKLNQPFRFIESLP